MTAAGALVSLQHALHAAQGEDELAARRNANSPKVSSGSTGAVVRSV